MAILAAILLQAASATALPVFDVGAALRRPGCDGQGDDVVVCGRRTDRYRLPLPIERERGTRDAGDPPTGMAALTPAAPCGIFQGQRSCAKADAAEFGYGDGRDPVTLLSRLAATIASGGD